MTNNNIDRDQIIKKYREIPRNPRIWKHLNLIIDEILKKGLKDSPILKYNPSNLIEPLWHCYYILRSKYWTNIYDQFVNDDYSNPEFRMVWSLTRFIDIHTPLYIRIVSLLLRIIYDRLEFSVYRQLPPLPSELYSEPLFHSYGTLNTTIYSYIDKITNNTSLKIKEFFIEAVGIDLDTRPKALLSENVLLPIPTYFEDEYDHFLIETRKIFSKSLFTKTIIYHEPISIRDKNGKIREGKMINFTPGDTEYIKKSRFVSLIIRLIKFLEKIYLSFLGNINKNPLKTDCEFFYYLLNKFRQDPSKPVKFIYDILEAELALKDIFEDLLNKYTYFPSIQKISLANPLKVKNLFNSSLDLFRKPIIKDWFGFGYFSTFWLFDCLVSELTFLLREEEVGQERGFRTEHYYFKQTQEFVKLKFPSSNAIGPFKLVLINESKKNSINTNNVYKTLQNSVNRFKLKCYNLCVPSNFINNLDFVEFDLGLIIKDTLFLLEIKDDIFWDIRDLPYILIRWGFNLTEKLKKNSKILTEPFVVKELNNKGLIFKDIKTMVISQKNIIHPVFNILTDLFQEIHKLHGENVIIGKFYV